MGEPIDREKEFYGAALQNAETGYASTGYGMPYNQQMRFLEWKKQVLDPEYFATMETEPDYTLLDIGSGTGDLPDWLLDEGLAPKKYLGLDIMPEMTKRALARHEEKSWPDGWRFKTGDLAANGTFLTDDMLGKNGDGEAWDHVVSIAAYALKEDHSSQQEEIAKVKFAIERMVYAARKSVFVTLFSTWKTNIIPEEMVLDPVTMFAWAKSQWERVDLIHSYAPFDFSLVIRKDKSPWRQAWERENPSMQASMAPPFRPLSDFARRDA